MQVIQTVAVHRAGDSIYMVNRVITKVFKLYVEQILALATLYAGVLIAYLNVKGLFNFASFILRHTYLGMYRPNNVNCNIYRFIL